MFERKRCPMRKRILAIDQSSTIQVLLATFLEMEGHQVITCSTAREAVAILSGLQQLPDVIILSIDYHKEAYRVFEYTQAHERYSGIRFVAMVLPAELDSIQRTLQGREVSYVHKPFHIQDVLASVSSVPLSQAEMR